MKNPPVSGTEDINGDSLADLIIGAYNTHHRQKNSAQDNYVVFGKPDTNTVSLSNISNGIGGFVIDGWDADFRI